MPRVNDMFFDDILKGNIAFINRELIEGEIKGVCLYFHAFGDEDLIYAPRPLEFALAKKGILSAFIFYDVWQFGSDITAKTADAVYSALCEKFGLKKDIPAVLFGEGVGATAALNCARMTDSINLSGCLLACPVTDLYAHAKARGDMDAVYFTAFRHLDTDFDSAVDSMSPILHINEMPDIPYRFILPSEADPKHHADKYDRGIVFAEQYDAYINKMKNTGLDASAEIFAFCNCPLPKAILESAADTISDMIAGGQK